MDDRFPDRALLRSMISYALGRGLPPQAAEDVVFEAVQKARDAYDPERGSQAALLQGIVRNDAAYWWRQQQRTERAYRHLALVQTPPSGARAESAAVNQRRLLEALEPEERTVFHAWASQRHLGRGRTTAAEIGRSIGLDPRAFDNAKRRLRARLERLLPELGLTPRTLVYGDDDAESTG